MVKLQTGRVVKGKIVVEDGERLPEGAIATVVIREPDDSSDLSEELDSELAGAIEEADRGELVDVESVLARLKRG